MSDKVMSGSHFVGAWAWDKEGPGFGPLYKAHSNALKVTCRFNEKRAEIESCTLLTPEGKGATARARPGAVPGRAPLCSGRAKKKGPAVSRRAPKKAWIVSLS